MTEQQIREAYVRIRTIDHTIPDDVLDFMKDAAIQKLREQLAFDELDELEDDDRIDYDLVVQEQEEEERAQTAAECTCGAWGFSKTGQAVKIADCCCGAE